VKSNSEDSSSSSTPRRKDKSLERDQQTLTRNTEFLVRIQRNIIDLHVQSQILLPRMLFQFIQWIGRLQRAIEPRYQLPHKDYFSGIAMLALYEDTRQNVLSTLRMEQIIILELQISGLHVPQSHIYHLQSITLTQIGVHLRDVLSVTMEQWNLDQWKVTAITTDSGSNIKLACHLLKWKR